MVKKYDIEYSSGIEQPRPTWAKPFFNGPLKAFFMPGILFGREFIELAQRMDIEFETVAVEKNWDLNKWGIGEHYHIRGGIGDFHVAYMNLEAAMTSDEWYDVLVLPSVNGWGFFGRKALEAIEARVEKGAGPAPSSAHGWDTAQKAWWSGTACGTPFSMESH